MHGSGLAWGRSAGQQVTSQNSPACAMHSMPCTLHGSMRTCPRPLCSYTTQDAAAPHTINTVMQRSVSVRISPSCCIRVGGGQACALASGATTAPCHGIMLSQRASTAHRQAGRPWGREALEPGFRSAAPAAPMPRPHVSCCRQGGRCAQNAAAACQQPGAPCVDSLHCTRARMRPELGRGRGMAGVVRRHGCTVCHRAHSQPHV